MRKYRLGPELTNGCRLVRLRSGLRFLVDRDGVPVHGELFSFRVDCASRRLS